MVLLLKGGSVEIGIQFDRIIVIALKKNQVGCNCRILHWGGDNEAVGAMPLELGVFPALLYNG